MILNNWGVRLLIAALAFAGTLACSTSGLFVAEATVTPTRTPRPTFTPLPKATDTPLPLPTLPPAPTPQPIVVVKSPTKPPTAKPATKAPTARPATAAPTTVAQPTAIPPTAAPVPTYAYGVNPPTCQHAGGTYIKGKVYDGIDPSSGGVAGMRVALGPADGTMVWVEVKTFDDGVYSFTLASDGQPAKVGSYYIWLLDGSGKRISPVSGAININGKGPDAPDACWAGAVDFWKR